MLIVGKSTTKIKSGCCLSVARWYEDKGKTLTMPVNLINKTFRTTGSINLAIDFKHECFTIKQTIVNFSIYYDGFLSDINKYPRWL